jgi:hypothetical protein
MPVWGSANADGAIDVIDENSNLQINDNVLEGGKTAGYNGIVFSSTIDGADANCSQCMVSNNTIKRFGGSGIVAEAYGSSFTLEYSMISKNDVEDNGQDGILIGNASGEANAYNQVFDNKAKGNAPFDCEDDTYTYGSLTLTTYNTWINNIGPLSYPTGLCSSGGWGYGSYK